MNGLYDTFALNIFEILEMSNSDLIREQHKEAIVCATFGQKWFLKLFKNSRIIAMLLLSIFPSTHICDSSFSIMNIIKNQDRNSWFLSCTLCIVISVS